MKEDKGLKAEIDEIEEKMTCVKGLTTLYPKSLASLWSVAFQSDEKQHQVIT